MGLEEAILQEVREQGIEQNKRTVIRLYEKGMPIIEIAEITAFTVEEVEKIIEDYNAEKDDGRLINN